MVQYGCKRVVQNTWQFTLFKLINNGTLNFEQSYGTLSEKMQNKMYNAKRSLDNDCSRKTTGF